MATITFGSTKGGCGKTTSAITLATTIARFDPELRITMIDCDQESYLADWAAISADSGTLPANIKVIEETSDRGIADAIHDAEENSDIVIVDPEGKATMLLRDAILLSDLTLIPLQPSPMDARAIPKIVDVIDRAARSRKSPVVIEYHALFNRTKPIGISKEHQAIIEGCKENKVPVLSTELFEREVFKGYLSVGGTMQSRLVASQKVLDEAIQRREIWKQENIDRLAGRISKLSKEEKAEQAELKSFNQKVIAREKGLIKQLMAAIENSDAVANEVLAMLEIAVNNRSTA